MLRIRRANGELVTLPDDAVFVEICSADGKVSNVFVTPSDGSITHVRAGTEEAVRYKTAYGVPWCATKVLPAR